MAHPRLVLFQLWVEEVVAPAREKVMATVVVVLVLTRILADMPEEPEQTAERMVVKGTKLAIIGREMVAVVVVCLLMALRQPALTPEDMVEMV